MMPLAGLLSEYTVFGLGRMCRLSAKKILLRKVSLPRADQERHVPDTLWSSTSSKFSNTKDTISMSSTKARVAESVLDKQFE